MASGKELNCREKKEQEEGLEIGEVEVVEGLKREVVMKEKTKEGWGKRLGMKKRNSRIGKR